MKKITHYEAKAVCPGRPVIGHATVREGGRIDLLLYCTPLGNQVIELVPAKPDDE